jgi:hypothetical protein
MAPYHDIKPDPYRPPTMEDVHRARTLYQENFTVSRILAATGMSLGTLYYWLDGGPVDENGQRMLPPIPRRRAGVLKRRRPLTADRASLAARLLRTADRQARDIELRLARPDTSDPARERGVRMLAMLTRTLRDLSGFDSGVTPAGAGEASEPKRSQAEILASLTRKLDALVAEEEEEQARNAAEAAEKEAGKEETRAFHAMRS